MVNLLLCCVAFATSLSLALSSVVRPSIILGNEILRQDNYAPLLGKRIGLFLSQVIARA